MQVEQYYISGNGERFGMEDNNEKDNYYCRRKGQCRDNC